MEAGKKVRVFRVALALLAALGAAPTAVRLEAADQAPVTLLPTQLGTWGQRAWEREEAPALERLAGTEAALLREYGCMRVEQALYARGRIEWRVTVYEMQDRSGAYGAFTLLRAGGQSLPLGEAGARIGGRLVFYQGNYFASVESTAGAPDLPGLARHLAARNPLQPSLPTLPSYLPPEGLVAGSERYLLGPQALRRVAPLAEGDWVGFAYAAEVEAARYRLGANEATLLLISYPTPQIAADRLRDFERLFNLNGTGAPLRPLVYAKRSGTLVVFLAGVESGQEAARLLGQVRYEAELAWSEPSEPRSAESWAKTLLNISIGTGLLLLFTLLSGLAFGVVRLLVKRLLPGRVFDRPEDTEIIRLNLGPGR